MNWRKNRIAIGALVLSGLLGLTLWAVNSRNQPTDDSAEIPSLELEKDAITALEITRPEKDRVVLSKVDGAWRVTEPIDASADQNNVESALNRLDDLKIRRIVANKPDNYARLQIDDASAVQVIARAGEDTIVRLRVGKYSNGMTMIRIDDRDEVFGASGSLRYAFDRELKAWRNRQIVGIKPADVQSIRFESAKGTFQFQREGDGWIALEGKKALGDFDSKQVTNRLTSVAPLTASDFAPDDTSAARAGLTTPEATVTLTVTDDPNPIILEIGDSTEPSGGRYLRRQGNPIIYVVSQHIAERLQPGPTAFAAPKVAPAPATPNAPPGDGQQPQLPPEVMRQLQEQIRAQQQQGQ